jgi:hypothetical protein
MLPSASGTVAAGPELENAIQLACESFEDIFKAVHDDNRIRMYLDILWLKVCGALEQAGDSDLKGRLKSKSEFCAHVEPESDQEQELINLVRSMANGQVPWRNLFENGTSFVPLTPGTPIIIFHL